jgi:hypothetical protein
MIEVNIEKICKEFNIVDFEFDDHILISNITDYIGNDSSYLFTNNNYNLKLSAILFHHYMHIAIIYVEDDGEFVKVNK